MARFELASPTIRAKPRSKSIVEGRIGSDVAVRNVLWFITLRWIVVAVFLAAELTAVFLGPALRDYGIEAPRQWPWILALILSAANICFLIHARKLVAQVPSGAGVYINLWIQIVVDLATLTVVVHYLGSLTTFICFAYLFHTGLACIFFVCLYSSGHTTKSEKYFLSLMIFFSIMFMLLTYSRGPIIFTGLLILWKLVANLRKNYKFLTGTIFGGILGGWIVFPWLQEPVEQWLEFMAHRIESGSDGGLRSFLYTTAWEAIEDNPIFGIGYGNFKDVFFSKYGYAAMAHNDFLEVTSETGVIAGSLFLCVIVSSVFSWKFVDKNIREIFFLPSVYLIMNSLLRPLQNQPIFWLLIFIPTILASRNMMLRYNRTLLRNNKHENYKYCGPSNFIRQRS